MHIVSCGYALEFTSAQLKHLIHAILSLFLSAGGIQVDSRAIKNKSSSRDTRNMKATAKLVGAITYGGTDLWPSNIKTTICVIDC